MAVQSGLTLLLHVSKASDVTVAALVAVAEEEAAVDSVMAVTEIDMAAAAAVAADLEEVTDSEIATIVAEDSVDKDVSGMTTTEAAGTALAPTSVRVIATEQTKTEMHPETSLRMVISLLLPLVPKSSRSARSCNWLLVLPLPLPLLQLSLLPVDARMIRSLVPQLVRMC